MKNIVISGKINSIQTLGTLDGPGVRFVVFMQGCNLRCGCCHNPDTWDINQGQSFTAKEIAEKAERFKSYFGNEGGITVSGGEPLLQPEFVTELFKECKSRDINTCLDTSGSILNDEIKEMLKYTDLVLLDVKYTTDEQYKAFVGCSIQKPLAFLAYLNETDIPVFLRQVIIPTLNDNKDNIDKLKKIKEENSCVKKIELLPFKKICKSKYDNLGIEFSFDSYNTPSPDVMKEMQELLD